MGSYSTEDVRGFARQKAEGKSLDSDRQEALDRTTSQAGAEGRLVNRLIGGSKE